RMLAQVGGTRTRPRPRPWTDDRRAGLPAGGRGGGSGDGTLVFACRYCRPRLDRGLSPEADVPVALLAWRRRPPACLPPPVSPHAELARRGTDDPDPRPRAGVA